MMHATHDATFVVALVLVGLIVIPQRGESQFDDAEVDSPAADDYEYWLQLRRRDGLPEVSTHKLFDIQPTDGKQTEHSEAPTVAPPSFTSKKRIREERRTPPPPPPPPPPPSSEPGRVLEPTVSSFPRPGRPARKQRSPPQPSPSPPAPPSPPPSPPQSPLPMPVSTGVQAEGNASGHARTDSSDSTCPEEAATAAEPVAAPDGVAPVDASVVQAPPLAQASLPPRGANPGFRISEAASDPMRISLLPRDRPITQREHAGGELGTDTESREQPDELERVLGRRPLHPHDPAADGTPPLRVSLRDD